MNCWLSKLASTFVLALVEEKLAPLNSLYFSIHVSLKSLTKQSKTELPLGKVRFFLGGGGGGWALRGEGHQ